MRRGVGIAALIGALALAACGGHPDADFALETVRGGLASEPVAAVLDTTTTSAPAAEDLSAPAPGGPVAPRTLDAFEQRAPAVPKAAKDLVVMGRLRIPRLSLDTLVYEGSTLDVIDHGPGHFPESALPGRRGNVAIAGHRVTHSRPFRYLDTLQPGDQAIFDLPDGGHHIYEFTGHEIVTPDRVDIVEQTDDFRATLFGCHPPGSAKYRIVAYWKLVSAPVLPPPPPPPTTTTTSPASGLGGLFGN